MTRPVSETGRRNDQIRHQGLFGPDQPCPLMVTPGVRDLGDAAIGHLVLQFMAYDDFDTGNDPYGNHDFGILDSDGIKVWFRIEPKEGEPENRVITFHLPEEN